jgi:hypothetical protein
MFTSRPFSRSDGEIGLLSLSSSSFHTLTLDLPHGACVAANTRLRRPLTGPCSPSHVTDHHIIGRAIVIAGQQHSATFGGQLHAKRVWPTSQRWISPSPGLALMKASCSRNQILKHLAKPPRLLCANGDNVQRLSLTRPETLPQTDRHHQRPVPSRRYTTPRCSRLGLFSVRVAIGRGGSRRQG